MTCNIFWVCIVLSFAEPYCSSEQLYSLAIVGGKVVLDCISNAPGPVDWWYEPFGTYQKNWIARGNETISEIYKTKTETTGQVALIIEWVNLSTAGMYKCRRLGRDLLQAELTVLDGIPQCNASKKSPSTKVSCSFRYAGNHSPELALAENDTWSMNCSTRNGSLDCEFEGSCNVTMLAVQGSTVFKLCGVDDNCTCEWDINLTSVYIKGTNKSIGGWNCTQTSSSSPDLKKGTTTKHQSLGDSKRFKTVFIVVFVLILVLGILVFIVVLTKRYGVWSKNRLTSDRQMGEDNHIQTQMDIVATENSVDSRRMPIYSLVQRTEFNCNMPVYTEVKKKKQQNGSRDVISDNFLYQCTPLEQRSTKQNNFDTDGIIYAQLGQVPPKEQIDLRAPPIRDRFNLSEYAAIDHTHITPPPSTQITFN